MDNDLFEFAQGYFAFGNHPQADRWAGYSEGARRGALAHARQQFDDALATPIDWAAERWRRAAAEQAFALLVLGGVANARAVGGGEHDALTIAAQAAGDTGQETPPVEMAGPFAKAALRAAGWGGHVALRG